MMVLALKLLLTPVLIGAASLAQRRYGPRVGGLLVGLPLTSGPVALFLALEHGSSFAARSAHGTLLGLIAETAFCLAYAIVAGHRRWPVAASAAVAAFAVAAAVLQFVPDPLVFTYLTVLLVLAAGVRFMPPLVARGSFSGPPWWDLPTRVVVATAFVLALTAAAETLGAKVSGLLSPFPIYAGVLVTFTHAVDGGRAAAMVLRGVLLGLFAFASFFLVLGATLEHASIATAFGSAAIAAVLVQAIATWACRSRQCLGS